MDCVDCLTNILENPTFPSIVRHEVNKYTICHNLKAGEALGAIADLSSLDVLKKHQNNQISEVYYVIIL